MACACQRIRHCLVACRCHCCRGSPVDSELLLSPRPPHDARAITTAILIWSARFADNLLGRPAPGGQRLTAVRLALHTVSAIGVIVGVITARSWLVVAGAV